MTETLVWRHEVGWAEARVVESRWRLRAEAKDRERVARHLGLQAVDSLSADLVGAPWQDGLEITGTVWATVTRLCGVSLESFDETIDEPLRFRVVPQTSARAPRSSEREVIVDLDEEDPPDGLNGDTVDLGAYVVEALGLALDPFPRKPGMAFEPLEEGGAVSPFAVLASLNTTLDQG